MNLCTHKKALTICLIAFSAACSGSDDPKRQRPNKGNTEDTGIDTGTEPSSDDADGDGFIDDDCDDTNPDVNPGAAELPRDGIDNDCDDDIDCKDSELVNGEWEGDVNTGDIPALCVDYDCRSVSGNLTVEFSNLSDLADLACLTLVEGDLTIRSNDSLTTLSGLDSLTEVEGNIFIDYSEALSTLSGLDSLEKVGEALFIGGYIYGATSIVSLEGLGSVTDVGYLYVWSNDSLQTLDGLDSLAHVEERIDISDNASLTTLSGLDLVTDVGEDLRITDNPELADVSALYGLANVAGDVVITNNASLTDEAAQDLVDEIDNVGGSVTISGN